MKYSLSKLQKPQARLSSSKNNLNDFVVQAVEELGVERAGEWGAAEEPYQFGNDW